MLKTERFKKIETRILRIKREWKDDIRKPSKTVPFYYLLSIVQSSEGEISLLLHP